MKNTRVTLSKYYLSGAFSVSCAKGLELRFKRGAILAFRREIGLKLFDQRLEAFHFHAQFLHVLGVACGRAQRYGRRRPLGHWSRSSEHGRGQWRRL